jgi:iron complex outermembrane receptor protein
LYKRTTKDLLLNTQPFFLWFSNKDNYNVGNIDNKGIELLAEVIAIRTTEWRIGGNVTFQNSKITKLTTVQPNSWS